MLRQFELLEKIKSYDPDVQEEALNKAYVFAMQAHGTQLRASGDPYFSHPIEVAGILAEMKFDSNTIITALLHDVVEDTKYNIKDIKKNFGIEVSNLVDGFATTASDIFSIALNGANTATVSGTAVSDYDPSALSDQLYNEWVAKNVTASATWSKWDISSSETGTVTTIKFTAKDSGTSQIGEGLTFTTTIDSATMTSIGYKIGNAFPGQNTNDAGDNVARGNGIVVSFLAATGGTNRGEIGSPWISNTAGVNNVTITVTGVTVHELSTTLNRSIADSGTITDVNTYPNDSRSDVITPQAIIGATASDASSFSRITWL